MTPYKLYATKKSKSRRVGVLVDLDDYLKYRKYKLKFLPNGKIYFREGGQKRFLLREILQLTQPYTRVFSKSGDRLDCRKQNLIVKTTPEYRRGMFAVQFLNTHKN